MIMNIGKKCIWNPNLSLILLPLPSARSIPLLKLRSFARTGKRLPAQTGTMQEAQRNAVASRLIAPSNSVG
jgi:hypothetical protein